MEEIIISYVNEQFPNEQNGEKIGPQDDLLGGGILDSLGMMRLIQFIENEFNIKVPAEDMTIENFMTIKTIGEYISGK
ncbi:MAG: acyl carrier protein [Bacteroidota bacterium]